MPNCRGDQDKRFAGAEPMQTSNMNILGIFPALRSKDIYWGAMCHVLPWSFCLLLVPNTTVLKKKKEGTKKKTCRQCFEEQIFNMLSKRESCSRPISGGCSLPPQRFHILIHPGISQPVKTCIEGVRTDLSLFSNLYCGPTVTPSLALGPSQVIGSLFKAACLPTIPAPFSVNHSTEQKAN